MDQKVNTNCVVSLDWLSLTIFTSLEDVMQYVEVLGLHEGLTEPGYGTKGFARMHVGLGGFRIGSSPTAAVRDYCTLFLPGEAMAHVGLEKLQNLYHILQFEKVRWQVSRLDVAFDTKDFSVQQVEDAWFAGSIDIRSKKFKPLKDYNGDKLEGHTLYFGSRQSNAMLRVYWKRDGNTFGAGEDFTRVELELKAERATLTLHYLMMTESLSDVASRAVEILNGFVYVHEDFWRGWLGTVRAWWVSIKRSLPTVDSMGRWLKKQVAPTFATYFLARSSGDIGDLRRLIDEFMSEGKKRLDQMQKALIGAYEDVGDAVYGFEF